MCSEEVAKSHKRSDGLDICRRFGILDGLEFVFAGLDSLRCSSKTLVSENAFFQIDFQVIFVQPGKYIIEDGEVFFMSVCVHQEVIDVHQHIGSVSYTHLTLPTNREV